MKENYRLKSKWKEIFPGSDWEICKREGTICGIESTDERIERAKALIFSDISALQNDELCHGVFLEEFSMGWAFTQEGFWLGDSAGQKDCILYKDIYGVHLSEYEHNPFICCLELRSKKENLEHQGSMNYHDATFIRYKLETNNTKPIVPSTVVEKIGGYWWKIYEYRKAI